MIRLGILGVIFFGLTAFTGGKEGNEEKSTEGIQWITIEEAIEIAASGDNDKLFFIDVYTDWCGWCKRMDATTFQHAGVVEAMNQNFYAVKFDGEAKRDIDVKGQTFSFVPSGRRGYHELAAALLQGKMSYPTVVFLDEKFNMIQPIPGYRGGEEFLPIVKFLGEKHYKNESFEDFMAKYSTENTNSQGK